jgi:hypothetical protein
MKRKRYYKYKLRAWMTKTSTRIHNIIFPRCYIQHLFELKDILQDFGDSNILITHLLENLKVREELDKGNSTFHVLLAGRGLTLIFADNHKPWKHDLIKHFIKEAKLTEIVELCKDCPDIHPNCANECPRIPPHQVENQDSEDEIEKYPKPFSVDKTCPYCQAPIHLDNLRETKSRVFTLQCPACKNKWQTLVSPEVE